MDPHGKPQVHHGHAAGTDKHKPRAHAPIRTLILCPTRELASQIGDSFRAYGRHQHLHHTVIFGGVSQHHQVKALRAGVEIVIATPGRLLDLMNQGFVDLRHIEIFVLDEADRMLDMGFMPDIRRIIQRLPAGSKRQTLLFSATMPNEIRALAESILHQPVRVQVNPVASTVDTVSQSVYFVQRKSKPALLTHLLRNNGEHRTLVFTRTKHGADKVVRELERHGIRAQAIHGNKSQNNRTRALSAFKSNEPPVLVATDIASRGIDVDGITHVINFDMPHEPETYVHRIGRTARAGASGVAISFCDHEERDALRAIERLTRATIEVNADMPGLPSSDVAGPSREPAARNGHQPHAAKKSPSHAHGHKQRPRGWPKARPESRTGAKPQREAGSHRNHSASHAGQSRRSENATHHSPKKQSGFLQRGRGKGRRGSGRPAH